MSLSIFNITISLKFNLNITLHHLSFSILIICALDMEIIRILKCIIILILNPINFKILLKMNMILACTAVYGIFAPYTAGGHGILDIQRNSSCDPCPSPTFVSPPLSSPPPIPAWPESGGKRVAETRNRISLTHFLNG